MAPPSGDAIVQSLAHAWTRPEAGALAGAELYLRVSDVVEVGIQGGAAAGCDIGVGDWAKDPRRRRGEIPPVGL
jgi:hypothetical protein